MNLKDYWFALAGKFSEEGVLITNLFDELVERYAEPHRFYHTFSHVGNLLRLSEEYAGHISNKEVIDFSIFYHDIICRPGRSDNEQLSAERAKDALEKLKIADNLIEEIVTFIEATKDHQLAPIANIDDLKLFLDFDLSILSEDDATYNAYANAVREEFQFIPQAAYAMGRSSFLQSLLSKPNIFFTEMFRVNAEQKARKNIQREIDSLVRHI